MPKPRSEVRYDSLTDVLLCVKEALRYARRVGDLSIHDRDRDLVTRLESLEREMRLELRRDVLSTQDGV